MSELKEVELTDLARCSSIDYFQEPGVAASGLAETVIADAPPVSLHVATDNQQASRYPVLVLAGAAGAEVRGGATIPATPT